jgi:predicted transcriptional regulator
MRILDIIKPLYEFAPPTTGTGSIELIKNLLSMVMNHELEGPAYKQAVDLLVDLETSAEAIEQDTTQPDQQPQQPIQPQPILQPQTPQPVQEPVVQPEVPEEEPLAEAIRNHTKALNNLLARVNDPTKWATLVAAKRAKGVSDQDIYELLGSGMELQHQITVEWDDELEKTAEILADKIVKNAEIIHSAIEANLKKDAGNKTEVAEAKIKAGTKEKAANTQTLITNAAGNTLDSIAGSGLGAGQGFTDKDLKFLQEAKSFRIDMTDTNIRRVIELQERAAKAAVNRYNERLRTLPQQSIQQMGLTPITLPKTADEIVGGQ